jgi:hypothetical protein
MKCLFWRALFGFVVFDLRGFNHDFPGLYTFVRNRPVCNRTASSDIVARICTAVSDASVWYPKQVRCLQRSAITTCLLRRCGIPASMVMGAQVTPLRAHAWTEVDGKAVNERRDVQRIYSVWERC